MLGRRCPELRLTRLLVAQIPPYTLKPFRPARLELANRFARSVDDLDLHIVVHLLREVVVERSPIWGIFPGYLTPALRLDPLRRAKAVRGPRLEKMHVFFEKRRLERSERREIVENVEAAAIRRDDEIREVLLDGQPVDRRGRHVRPQRRPVLPVIERDVNLVVRPRIEHAATLRIFTNDVNEAEDRLWNAFANPLEALAVIRRLIDVGREVAILVVAESDIGRSAVVA